MQKCAFLAVAWLVHAVAQIPEEYAEDITVYHVNPLSEGSIPINMDSADALGDVFFDFRSKVVPIECAPGKPVPTHGGKDCKNQEVTAKDLVITKLVLTIDNRFGDYGLCNICVNESATGVKNCTNGEYVCACRGQKGFTPCAQKVGLENVTQHFAARGCRQGQEEWECWRSSVAKKTGGLWYSTFASGYCGDGSKPAPAGCTWKVKSVPKVINKTCSDNSVYNYLETYDQDAQNCFSSCADSGLGPQRNTSSTCWIKCFYTTVLGPDAGIPGGDVTGVPREKIVAAWEKAFVSSKAAEGGCPSLNPSSMGTCLMLDSRSQGIAPSDRICAADVDCDPGSFCSGSVASPATSKGSLSLVV